MRFSKTSAAAIAVVLPLTLAQTSTDCNPTEKSCPADVGLDSSTYSADFTQPDADASWTAAAGTTITYGTQGAEFTIDQSTDAPTFSTDFYFLFGRVDVKMKASTGTGIVSSVVLESDDLDEVDWEWLGGDLTHVQTNFFGKGNTTSYDRGTYQDVSAPQTTFHTYSFDWTADRLQWLIDGVVVRTLEYSDPLALGGKNYPQTPMRVKLGSWCGGCSSSEGTATWAGGKPSFSDAPYVMYVETIAITNYNPASSYSYSDETGDWQSIDIVGGSSSSSSSSASESSSATDSTSATDSSTAASSTTVVIGSATATTSVDSTATAAPTSMIAVSGLQDHSGVVQSTTIVGSAYSTNSASVSAQNSGSTLLTSVVSTQVPGTTPSSTTSSSGTPTVSATTGTNTNGASTMQKSVAAGSLLSMALAWILM